MEEYESLIVSIGELKEEIQNLNKMIAGIFNVLYDFTYKEDNRVTEEEYNNNCPCKHI